ncbi:hypothetical protein ARNL5_01737 [Anaerolineae bacterium]|nr:hypothetical protein ARNL5_01737 [Anaerolineae bacterium]
MGERFVEGFEVNGNIKRKMGNKSLDKNTAGAGTVPAAVAPYVSVAEYGDGVFHQTVFTITALPITMRDTEQGGGAQIYDFPLGRIFRLGATGTIAVTTTSILANTLNAGVTCNWGVGSTTQASATLATTEQDFVNVTAFTASATINVAGANSTGVGPSVLASLDGTSTAVDAFLNLAVAGATDIDADATVTVTGTVKITWVNLS